jgi:hypothetical protein
VGCGGGDRCLDCGADELAGKLWHADFLEVGVGDYAQQLFRGDALRLQDGERFVFDVFVGNFEAEYEFFELTS